MKLIHICRTSILTLCSMFRYYVEPENVPIVSADVVRVE